MMKRFRNVALGSLTAAAALLTGLAGADAQTAPGGGSFPGSFLIPGTNTSLKIGGYAKGDFLYDFSARGGDNFSPAGIPLEGTAAHTLHGNTRIHAKQSRINFETRTPTSYGELKTYIEFDFFGGEESEIQSNSSRPRLRHAYGTLGPLLVGQTWSLFDDTRASPETLDFNGPVGVTVNRQPQFRYTYLAGNGVSFAVSIENPEADGTNGVLDGAIGSQGGGVDNAPDGVIAATLSQAWGHVELRAVLRDITIKNAALANHSTQFGYGVGFSGHLNTFGKDNLKWNLMYGDGIGRYIQEAGGQAVEFDATGATVDTIRAYGGFLAYQHWWTSQLRSTLAGGYVKIQNSGVVGAATLATLNKRFWGTHVNLIWSPVPQVDLGVEYIHGNREIESGADGDFNRAQVSAIFKF